MRRLTSTERGPDVLALEDAVADGVRALLVLDIDGVLNALSLSSVPQECFPIDRRERCPNPDYAEEKAAFPHEHVPRSYPIAWSSELVEAINALTADSRVQLVFLTSWQGGAASIQSLLGLAPGRPSAYVRWRSSSQVTYAGHHGKIPVLTALLRQTPSFDRLSAVAWADDDLFGDVQALMLARGDSHAGRASIGLAHLRGQDADIDALAGLLGDRLLVVGPDSNTGIDRPQWSAIADHVEAALDGAGPTVPDDPPTRPRRSARRSPDLPPPHGSDRG